MSRWEFFDPATDKMLACAHCGEMKLNDAFMQKVVEIRRAIGRPFMVTSGYRCPEHNNKVSKSGLTGPHTTGRAMDVAADSRLRYLIVEQALIQGMTRIGIARTFIHLDDLTLVDGYADKVIWTY